MGSGYVIQTATQDQVESVFTIVNTSFLSGDGGFYRIPNVNRIEKEELIQMIQNKDRYKVYVCINTETGEIMGTTYLDLEDCKLSMLAVAIRWKNYGIGSKILSYVEEAAKNEYHKDEIILDIVNDARQLHLKSFYEKRGYTIVGTGVSRNPKRFQYLGGQKIIQDGLPELPPDTVPIVTFKKPLVGKGLAKSNPLPNMMLSKAS
jgi:N-acetylglutamate synthase-like GNAT family acetyltransferase